MTNGDRVGRLLADSDRIAREMRRALRQRAYNLTTRRAQEVLELWLKALLAALGVDVPKLHDVAPALRSAVSRFDLGIETAFLDRVADLSRRLAEERAPALYHEREVEPSAARAYVREVEMVVRLLRATLARLGLTVKRPRKR